MSTTSTSHALINIPTIEQLNQDANDAIKRFITSNNLLERHEQWTIPADLDSEQMSAITWRLSKVYGGTCSFCKDPKGAFISIRIEDESAFVAFGKTCALVGLFNTGQARFTEMEICISYLNDGRIMKASNIRANLRDFEQKIKLELCALTPTFACDEQDTDEQAASII
jgi:hypothetical protein